MSSMSAAQMEALARDGMADGLTEAATFVRDATRPRTPNDPTTGGDDLSGSLTVEPATPSDLTAKVYTDSDHAVYQHEALNIRHPTGEAKFLENTTRDSARDVERIVGAALRRKFS